MEERKTLIHILLSFPDQQVYWQHEKRVYSAEFASYVESVPDGA